MNFGVWNSPWWWGGGTSLFGCGVPYGYYSNSYYGYSSFGNAWCASTYYSPFRSVCYSSPYHYRYRAHYPRYWYRSCYYTYSSSLGFYPCYSSSYSTYVSYRNSGELVLPETRIVERELTAGELRLCEGWTLLRSGDSAGAAQVLYTASLELEQSALVHWFLAVALADSGEMELASRALGEALFFDPDWFSHRWNADAHLGAGGAARLIATCREYRAEKPLSPSAIAIEGAVGLLGGDQALLADLRGEIAESLLYAPEAPALAEILAEVRRRSGSETHNHPSITEEAWLAFPSCEGISALHFGSSD